MKTNICQSCSMPLSTPEEYGTNQDGSSSQEYCIHCLQNGAFTQNITLDEAIAQCVRFADMAGATKEEALAYAQETFPTLKRWRQS